MPLTLYWRALIALFFIAAGLLPAHAQAVLPVPVLSARVIDQTQTLQPEELQALEQRLQTLEEKSGSQVVVLLVPSTAPEDIAAYAHRVASDWKIGRRDVGDGLLVVIAKNDRRMRIEVARALEGAIPDLAAARIIDDAMAPRFRADDYAGGIRTALEQIGARIAGEALPAPPARHAPASSQGMDGLAVFLFLGVMVIGPIVRRLFGQRLGALLVGSGAGTLAYWLTASLLLAGGAGVVALLFTLLSNGRSGGPFIGGGGLGGGHRGGFGGGGGGFSSGGGGSFGGGGASGSW